MKVEKCLSPKALLQAIKILVHGHHAALPGCGNGPRQINVVVVHVQGKSHRHSPLPRH